MVADPRPLSAKHPGHCVDCGKPYDPGTFVTRTRLGLRHAEACPPIERRP